MTNPVDSTDLRRAVEAAYSAAACDPASRHPFPVGREFAASVGYPAAILDRYPAAAATFAGVSNLAVWAELQPGMTVLDLGCGAGLDSLMAAERMMGRGRIVSVDFSRPMLERLQAAASSAITPVEPLHASAEELPLANSSVDAALVNGIFNLNPRREAIFAELARVLRPGGTVFGAELILQDTSTSPPPATAANWFA